VSFEELRGYLKERLPGYMVPAVFIPLPELPLTPNGKVDRRRLPAPDWSALTSGAAYEPPRTPVEELLGNIWSQLLGVERVGINDNFFELGGHSLLATRLLARVRAASGAELSLRSLFEGPTVRRMARLLEEALTGGVASPPPPIERVERGVGGGAELSYAQRRLWFLDQLSQGSPFYNLGAAIRLHGELDVSALERSLNEIVRRHEALRTTFVDSAGLPVGVISPPGYMPLAVRDLGGLQGTEQEEELQRLIEEEAQHRFEHAPHHLRWVVYRNFRARVGKPIRRLFKR
jgi:aryl carrier-like protein